MGGVNCVYYGLKSCIFVEVGVLFVSGNYPYTFFYKYMIPYLQLTLSW